MGVSVFRVLFSLLLLAGPALGQAAVVLNDEQQAYLAANPLATLCVDPDWVPFEVINARGEHEGIAADLLRLVAERVGLQLQLVPTAHWDDSLAASRAGQCQLLSFLNQTPEREAWLIFTEPLFTDVNVLIAREEHPFVLDPAALAGKSLALPSGTSIEERTRRDFPNLRIITTDNEAQALALVNERKADLTMRSLTVAAYTIKKEGWFNLKIAGQVPGYENAFRVGVLKGHEPLRDLLNLGIASITPAELNEIANRHVSIRVEAPVDYRLIGQLAAVFLIILLTSLFWIAKLRRLNQQLQVKSQTDSLTGLANRAALDSRFAIAHEQAQRYGRPLSLIMLDIDHFKRVNDDLGHQVGDQVLREFSELLKACARGSDGLGRWGGEEFLLLCPETDLQQARAFAERICARARQQPFASGRPQTLSAGVAELVPGDTLDALLQRADAALYQAKHEGRDRVCVRVPEGWPQG
jgi:diguanylate cyclase (GGDEF)-like protein